MSLMKEYSPWAQVWVQSWVVSFLGEPAWVGSCVCVRWLGEELSCLEAGRGMG